MYNIARRNRMLQNMRGHDIVINFSNSKVIDSGSHHTSKNLESWHTAVTNNAENNSMLLPRQYMILIKKNTWYFYKGTILSHACIYAIVVFV